MLYYTILYYTILYLYNARAHKNSGPEDPQEERQYTSGGRLCTLIGVPCRLSMLSTFSTFANVLFQYKSPGAEGAKTDPPPGYTYEGTQTTAWIYTFVKCKINSRTLKKKGRAGGQGPAGDLTTISPAMNT